MTKQTPTREILGIVVDTYRKWIEFQVPPDMTWDNIEIDHVKAICMFEISNEEELKEAFNWKIHSPYSNMIIFKRGPNIFSEKINFIL